ncbi:hypothetical protein [Pyrococcus horikoshii]|uniref:Uncharacterized protein n=1 Tax=Pyrococcus horikoshii (strain ATCC 700860 / DSM 12428 / JCM 9974 / NBRC 100139 / OT-3) TaxID=70601 RepID=O58031_PYRHO|nr:hypothetical protein [Pyrococcus horikoshii]BAA29365.1 148aa long hypothetical protein [Pyrococcus horikoshii OT3]
MILWEVELVKWKVLIVFFLGVLMVGLVAESVTATSQSAISSSAKFSPKPQPQYVIYGRKWKVDGVYYHTTEYTSKRVVATMECYASSGCSLSREVQECTTVSVSGDLKVSTVVIEETLGVTIGEQICKSITCTGYCKYGEKHGFGLGV